MVTASTIDRFLAIDSGRLTQAEANGLLALTASDDVKARVLELADKANFGTISQAERDEYQQYITLDELLIVAKARARKFMASNG